MNRSRLLVAATALALAGPECAPAGAAADSLSLRALAKGRYYRVPEGFLGAAGLPEGFRARVDSLSFDRRGAFEGTAALTSAERAVYAAAGSFHVQTRVSALRRRLPFAEGDTVDREALLEAERILRAEPFLSDAYLAAAPTESGCVVVVTAFDQWTTIPLAGVAVRNLDPADVLFWRWSRIKGSEWSPWIGVSEANVAGTGARAALYFRGDPERRAVGAAFSDGKATALRLRIEADAAWLSDGDSLRFSAVKPIETRSDEHAFGISAASRTLSERYWFDQNLLDRLPPAKARKTAGRDSPARVFEKVSTHSAEAFYLRSFGRDLKLDAGPFLRYRERYHGGGLGRADSALAPFAAGAAIEARLDVMPGAAIALYRRRLAGTRNFRNLKWSETVETGWRVSGEAAKDSRLLGARTGDWRLGGRLSASALGGEAWWLSASAACSGFVAAGADHGRGDGRLELAAEAAWRQTARTATWVTASWANLFASPPSAQLTLGDVDGLNGYASHAFAGQARLLLAAEQRWFPRFEWLTLVPAFAVTASAGNAFPTWRGAGLGNLHASLGAGLRLGRSKSTQKLVQHINVNFPVGEPLLPATVVTLLARRTL